ncbi:MAG: acetyl-CoA carboxylase carboxyltransferase subunit alpha [Acidobacteria bacterium]|nr:MAG: acetyl-CoA carboxylase carboxyltransferase subunit alpha [Acidobacteriota bacterium]
MSAGTANTQDFETPLTELRRRIEELEGYPEGSGHEAELARLRKSLEKATADVFAKLSPWQTTLVARHFDRPYSLDYVEHLMSDWVELHGDRGFADDPAIVTGFATFRGRSVAVVGHQKGRGTRERIRCNFGQPRPEGYRKALRIMRLAERFRRPIVSLIDTPGAYPGIGAEERGQAEAIARNLIEMASLTVPVVVVVTGEGGSGGALALGVGNRVYMLRYSIYSVISPEGCAAILWKDQEKKAEAAAALRLTAPDLLRLGVIDGIVPEPSGGAHTDPAAACKAVGEVLEQALDELAGMSPDELVAQRYDRFRALGAVEEK